MNIFVIVGLGLGDDFHLVTAFTSKELAQDWLINNPGNEIEQFDWYEVELHN